MSIGDGIRTYSKVFLSINLVLRITREKERLPSSIVLVDTRFRSEPALFQLFTSIETSSAVTISKFRQRQPGKQCRDKNNERQNEKGKIVTQFSYIED